MMSEDKVISVCLTHGNYSYWASAMKFFVVGKGMWVHVTRSIVKPTTPMKSYDPKHVEYVTAFAKWELENARVLT